MSVRSVGAPGAGSRLWAIRFAWLGILLIGLWALLGNIPRVGAAEDPPGNNGTIKIDGIPFDQHPNNEPHVGCVFEVDFYGYDKGDLYADVTFESHPPTGPAQVLLTDRIFIGEDDNSGGGSEAGHDAHRAYDLSDELAGIEPHPNQGFHVKLTINAEGSQGADVKHKVFWVEGCVGGAKPTPSPSPSLTDSTTSPPPRPPPHHLT